MSNESTANNRHDITVIGAGIIGVACALQLARQGLRVVVIQSANDERTIQPHQRIEMSHQREGNAFG